jgi:hypothetical protein
MYDLSPTRPYDLACAVAVLLKCKYNTNASGHD